MPLRRYGCNELKVKGIEAVKQTKELAGLAGTDEYGEVVIDESRPMITHKYCTCQDKFEMKLEVIGGAGVRGGPRNIKSNTTRSTVWHTPDLFVATVRRGANDVERSAQRAGSAARGAGQDVEAGSQKLGCHGPSIGASTRGL